MTHLRKKMLEELQRRNYSESTTRAYLHAVEQFAVHFGRSPDKLGPDDLRSYQAYLLVERKLAVGVCTAFANWPMPANRIGDTATCLRVDGEMIRDNVLYHPRLGTASLQRFWGNCRSAGFSSR